MNVESAAVRVVSEPLITLKEMIKDDEGRIMSNVSSLLSAGIIIISGSDSLGG